MKFRRKMAKIVDLYNSHTPRHCGLDPQSPLYIVVSGNLVKMAITKEVLLTNDRNDG